MQQGRWLATIQGMSVVGMLILGSACGGIGSSNGGGTQDSASASPLSVALVVHTTDISGGDSLPVTAQVLGSANTDVAWTVNDVSNGDEHTGTIAGRGNTVTYVAPATEGSYDLTARSVIEPVKSASVRVHVRKSSTVTVALSPTTSSLLEGAQKQFTATVSGSGQYNSNVTWSAQMGSITSTGLYTAPSSSGVDVVIAKSVQDASKSATASVIVTSSTSSPVISSVTLSPATLVLNLNAQNQFTATVNGTGSYNSAVTWSAQRGSISSTGYYTAPSTSGSDVVTASSVQDSIKIGSSSITVTSGSIPAGTSVKTYGAKGDGITDDTQAIQNTVNAIASGGTVIVPAGTYMINSQRDNEAGIILKSNMTLYISSGAILRCITSGATQGDVVRVRGRSNTTVTGPGTIQGDRATHTGPQSEMFHCLSINGSSNITVSGGLTLRDAFSDGIYISDDCSNITVDGVVCDNNRRQGMSITSCATALVQNSTFSNTHGTDPQCGIDLEPNAGQTVSDTTIRNCKFFNNVGGGFQQGAADSDYTYTFTTGTIFEDNELYGNGGAGYHDGGIAISDCDSNIIRNNYIHNNLDGGIKVFQHATNVTVTGNTVINNTGWGITMSTCSGSVATGNTVSGNSGNEFSVDSSSGTYSPNAVTGN